MEVLGVGHQEGFLEEMVQEWSLEEEGHFQS